MTNSNNLKLNVTNFGPIAKAEIDLRPLTVFVGPSNTGKSYLATLIYALHRFFNGDATGPRLGFRESTFLRSTIQEMPSRELNDMLDWMTRSLPDTEHKESSITVPEPIAALIRPNLELNEFAPMLFNDIVRCFGIDNLGRIVRHKSTQHTGVTLTNHTGTSSTSISPFKYAYMINKSTSASLDIESWTAEFHVDIPDNIPLQIRSKDIHGYSSSEISLLPRYSAKRRERTDILTELFGSILVDLVGSSIVAPLTRAAYYLPAGRASLVNHLRVMTSSIVSRSSDIVIQTQNVRRGPSGVVSDFIEQLINLYDDQDDVDTSYDNVSKRLENEMLKGAIRGESPDVGIPRFFYHPHGWKEWIPVMTASSMVSELAPVVLYLRHVVRPGQVLIIEEPEAHLHPGMQVEFIRQLAAAVRAGIRVMLTTHSEWVLEELANLVRLSDLPESQRGGVAGAGVALTPEEVGVWLFSHDDASEGSKVQEIQLDVDSGGFPTEYDDIAMDTYNKWARIGNLIKEARNGS